MLCLVEEEQSASKDPAAERLPLELQGYGANRVTIRESSGCAAGVDLPWTYTGYVDAGATSRVSVPALDGLRDPVHRHPGARRKADRIRSRFAGALRLWARDPRFMRHPGLCCIHLVLPRAGPVQSAPAARVLHG